MADNLVRVKLNEAKLKLDEAMVKFKPKIDEMRRKVEPKLNEAVAKLKTMKVNKKLVAVGGFAGFVVLLSMLANLLVPDEEFFNLLPYLPATFLQDVVVFVFWAVTSKFFPFAAKRGLIKFEDCFDIPKDETIKATIAPLKGGSVFSMLVGWELASTCGLSAQITTTAEGIWPSLATHPNLEYDLLMGIANPADWEEYVDDMPFNKGKKLQCVVFTRDPFERFMSMYKYARDGGESDLWKYRDVAKTLPTIEERVNYLWDAFGDITMSETHKTIVHAMTRPECVQMKTDIWFQGGEIFDQYSATFFRQLGGKEEKVDMFVKLMQKHDVTRLTQAEIDANQHVSGKSLEPGEKKAAMQFIRTIPRIRDALHEQCVEMNYDC